MYNPVNYLAKVVRSFSADKKLLSIFLHGLGYAYISDDAIIFFEDPIQYRDRVPALLAWLYFMPPPPPFFFFLNVFYYLKY